LQPSLQFALGAAPVSASVSAGDASELPEPPPPPCSSGLFVREPFGSKETKELIKQLNGTVQSAFGRSGARKLVRIVPDWAKHSDAAQVWSALRIVLRECKRITDAGHLRRVLSGFFLALPERWRSQAVSVFARLDQRSKSKERSWRSYLRFPS
jgi:hypothetical protein